MIKLLLITTVMILVVVLGIAYKLGVFQWIHVTGILLFWLVGNIIYLIYYWHRGRKGLDQYPEPHGRYYNEWLALGDEGCDYYDWLAKKMRNRKP